MAWGLGLNGKTTYAGVEGTVIAFWRFGWVRASDLILKNMEDEMDTRLTWGLHRDL